MIVEIPNEWLPRRHQLPLWQFMEKGGKRAVSVWHRRAGKDSTCLNWTAFAAHRRVGVYWHLLPTLNQGRRVVWDGRDREGRRFIDQAFPRPLRQSVNKQEMKIELKNGSLWQVVGSDNYNSLVGSNPIGVVFSEWSLADPAAWDFIRPILVENGGWAIFPYTPRGRNHGWDLYEMASTNAEWFCERLSIEDTGFIGQDVIESERQAGMSDELIEQEFYCSFDAPNQGSIYGSIMRELRDENRITHVPWKPELPVFTWWDIGRRDPTAIWFVQQHGETLRVIDYYENAFQDAAHYVKVVREKPYTYGESSKDPGHILPHDAGQTEWGSGKTRIETLANLGLKIKIGPKIGLEDGINAVRLVLRRCVFDAEKCRRGLQCLEGYQREWNEAMRVYSSQPLHNWASHGSDAFRYGAVAIRDKVTKGQGRPKFALDLTFDEMMAQHVKRARHIRERRL